MFKKIINRSVLALGTLGVVVAGAAAFSAFEAHVINVTAKIENALKVDTSFIEFGTVFPQEHLERPVQVGLSQSFLDEDRVDDVEYFIRQKPKCAITTDRGTNADLTVGQNGKHLYTGTGHIVLGDNLNTEGIVEEYWADCGPAPRQLQEGETWGVLPDLCPYISKNGGDEDGKSEENDEITPSFHKPFEIVNNAIVWLDTAGRLAKSVADTVDNWVIDLAVPCFSKYCAQDWEDFVKSHNPEANPSEFVQPIGNEHKVFGCDLWVEVSGVSTSTTPNICNSEIDLMLVLDRSGSIGGEMTTLKNAANAFVDALHLNGAHAGMTSFASTATLDVHVNNNSSSTLHTAINSATSSGATYLSGGIKVAKEELDNPGDGHDRPDGSSPDIMVIITDGSPNVCDNVANPGCDPETEAFNEAAAAKLAGIEIYVVGVGAGSSGALADYLKTIATDENHFFSATNFTDLESILQGIATCEE